MLELSARFMSLVRYSRAIGPRCFRWRMLVLSGPVELLFCECLIASDIWVELMLMGVGCRFLVCLSIFLFDLLVVCLVEFTN